MKINPTKIMIVVGIMIQCCVFLFPIYDDGAAMAQYIYASQNSANAFKIYSHLPLTLWLFSVAAMVTGISIYTLRIVPLLFNLLTLALLYYYVKGEYSSKIADISIILATYSFMFFLNGYLIDIDGSLAAFFSLLAYVAISKHATKRNNLWFVVFIISNFFLLSMKLRFYVLVPVYFLVLIYYTFIYGRKYYVFTVGYPFIVLLILLINFSFIYLFSNQTHFQFIQEIFRHNLKPGTTLINLVWNFISHPTKTTNLIQTSSFININPYRFITLIICLTPLSILLTYQIFFKKNKIPILLLSVLPILAFFFGAPFSVLTTPRYISFLIPFWIILIAPSLSKIDIRIRHITLSLLVLCALLISSNFDSSIYFVTSDGPIFFISLLMYALIFIFAASLFILFATSKKKWSYTHFIYIMFGINLFLIFQPIIEPTQQKLMAEVIKYSETNPISTVYAWSEEVPLYINNKNIPILELNNSQKEEIFTKNETTLTYVDLDKDFELINKTIRNNGGTIILVDFPLGYHKLSESLSSLIYGRCSLSKEVIEKKGVLKIYTC